MPPRQATAAARLLLALCVMALCLMAGGGRATGQPFGGQGFVDQSFMSQSVGQAAPEPVYWSQDVFIIPYQWSARTDPSSAKEVVLYLSGNRGATWSEVTRGKPDVQSFLYRAAADGEYWFAVRTLDENGRMWPAGGFTPELSVVVDTKIPSITRLDATLDTSGRLQVTCDAQDANLDSSKLELYVSHADALNWTQLPLSLADLGVAGGLRATASWQAPLGVNEVTLRLTIEDRAGNPAGAGKVVQATAVAQAIAANKPSFGPAMPAPAFSAAAGGSGDPFLAAPPLELPSAGTWASTPESPPAAPTTGVPWPADASASRPLATGAPTTWPTARPDRSSPNTAFASRRLENSPYHQASVGLGESSFEPSLQDSPPQLQPTHSSSTRDIDSYDSANVLLVNESKFALEYALESTGSWGVSKVEVWGTDDDGQTWRSYAVDSDNRSPVNIATRGPGRYGFRILVQGVGGLPVEPPRPGDRPEIDVIVDEQPPAVRLTSAGQGNGYFADHLIINWQATDEHLEPTPVSIAYSNRPSGPWMPIASGLANDQSGAGGRYAWRLQRHLPTQLYLRLEARDRAGNTAEAITPRPVQLDFTQPAARFQAARPLGD